MVISEWAMVHVKILTVGMLLVGFAVAGARAGAAAVAAEVGGAALLGC